MLQYVLTWCMYNYSIYAYKYTHTIQCSKTVGKYSLYCNWVWGSKVTAENIFELVKIFHSPVPSGFEIHYREKWRKHQVMRAILTFWFQFWIDCITCWSGTVRRLGLHSHPALRLLWPQTSATHPSLRLAYSACTGPDWSAPLHTLMVTPVGQQLTLNSWRVLLLWCRSATLWWTNVTATNTFSGK